MRPSRYTPAALSLAIFDLDGTLADSFPWFLRHVNDVADRFGFRRIAEHEIEPLRRAGSREILKRLDVPLWKPPPIARHMRRLKAAQIGDITLCRRRLSNAPRAHDAGVRLALVGSDDGANARAQLGASAELFTFFECRASIFGKAAKFRRVVKRAGVDPAHAPRSATRYATSRRPARPARIRGGHVGLCGAEALRALAPDLCLSASMRLDLRPCSAIRRRPRTAYRRRRGSGTDCPRCLNPACALRLRPRHAVRQSRRTPDPPASAGAGSRARLGAARGAAFQTACSRSACRGRRCRRSSAARPIRKRWAILYLGSRRRRRSRPAATSSS